MEIEVLGIDLGKTVCSVAGLDGSGAGVVRKRIQRSRLLDFFKPHRIRLLASLSFLLTIVSVSVVVPLIFGVISNGEKRK